MILNVAIQMHQDRLSLQKMFAKHLTCHDKRRKLEKGTQQLGHNVNKNKTNEIQYFEGFLHLSLWFCYNNKAKIQLHQIS
jgi:hypothetical protein